VGASLRIFSASGDPSSKDRCTVATLCALPVSAIGRPSLAADGDYPAEQRSPLRNRTCWFRHPSPCSERDFGGPG